MYIVIIENHNDLQRIKLQNMNSDEYVSVIPEFGANVNEIVFKKGSKLFPLIAGNKSRDEFEGSDIYNSAKLSPFPNRIKNGVYEFEEKTYQLPINHPQEGNAIHGFIYDKKFELIKQESSNEKAEITLSYDYDGSHPGYPFTFSIKITYCYDKNGLTCVTEIENSGNNSMPLNDGWHPYFSVYSNLEKVQLQIPEADIIMVDKLIPTGEKKEYKRFEKLEAINGEVFDTCFALKGNKEIYETKLFYPDEQLILTLWQDNKYKYLQIYTPLGRKSIALEPMMGNVNNFNTKENIIILKAGEKVKSSYGVSLK
jgi:aldose 1-epimerase